MKDYLSKVLKYNLKYKLIIQSMNVREDKHNSCGWAIERTNNFKY